MMCLCEHIGSPNCTVQLHASTSQPLLDIDKLIAELEESSYCIQQHYECIVAIACNFIGQ